MRLPVLTGILMVVVVQYAGVGNANLVEIQKICGKKYPVTPCTQAGWFRLDINRCIKIFEIVRTFNDAVRVCKAQGAGGDLVSIHNQNDYDQVLCLMIRTKPYPYPYWIGAKRDYANNWRKFLWQDKGKWTFFRWYFFQPDNYFFREGCVEMNNNVWGKWNDQQCIRKQQFVCAKTM